MAAVHKHDDVEALVACMDQVPEGGERDRMASRLLLSAAKAGRLACTKLLLEKYGADVNTRGRSGLTPLIQAAYHGHRDLVVVLLRAGATPELTNEYGETARQAARLQMHMECVQVLAAFEASRALPPDADEAAKADAALTSWEPARIREAVATILSATTDGSASPLPAGAAAAGSGSGAATPAAALPLDAGASPGLVLSLARNVHAASTEAGSRALVCHTMLIWPCAANAGEPERQRELVETAVRGVEAEAGVGVVLASGVVGVPSGPWALALVQAAYAGHWWFGGWLAQPSRVEDATKHKWVGVPTDRRAAVGVVVFCTNLHPQRIVDWKEQHRAALVATVGGDPRHLLHSTDTAEQAETVLNALVVLQQSDAAAKRAPRVPALKVGDKDRATFVDAVAYIAALPAALRSRVCLASFTVDQAMRVVRLLPPQVGRAATNGAGGRPVPIIIMCAEDAPGPEYRSGLPAQAVLVNAKTLTAEIRARVWAATGHAVHNGVLLWRPLAEEVEMRA